MTRAPIAVGIDLGTTNSSVAAIVGGVPTVLPDAKGRTTTPSVVSFPATASTREEAVLVGHVARPRLIDDPTNTVYSSKRLIGRSFADPAVRVARAAMPYAIVEGVNGQVAIQTRAGIYSVAEISAMVLREMTAVARRHVGTGPLKAVITVPANFNDAQREFTRVAGRIAGLEVLRIINEPTAAALAFGFDGSRDGIVAIYDFGGGTFDMSVVEIRDGVYRVLSTAGDPFLGGDDIDVALAGMVADKFRRESRVDLRRSQTEWQRLLFAAEQAKCELADREQTEIALKEAAFAEGGAVDLHTTVTRSDLATVAYGIVDRSIELTRRGLQAARLTPKNITEVVLVGGTTRVPLVASAARDFFAREPLRDIDPMHAVALGAGLHAALLTGIPIKKDQKSASPGAALLVDVLPHSIGMAIAGGGVEWVLRSNSVVPTEEKRRFVTHRHGQENLRLVLLQGDSPRAAECTKLGDFTVTGLRPAPAGEVQIEVTFEVDANGILSVTAIDLDSGRVCSRRLKISAPSDDVVTAGTARITSGRGGQAS
ncbi:MAG: Hsp70 family protein [Deltaproteobacteria bacterium]|nr:Hsp70 family protein [Deltaproteobacteria bacterium]